MTEPLRLNFQVTCPSEHAFSTWTHRISALWPIGHTASEAPGVAIVLEPRIGGRMLERTPDGAEILWGEVTIWEPPRRLGYLWNIRRDRSDATDVVISFVDQDDGTTCIEIEHSGWERLGSDSDTWRARNQRAWSTLLTHFEEAATQ